MTCRTVGLADNSLAIICTRGPKTKAKPCEECGKPSVALCDFPVAPAIYGKTRRKKPKTCDSPMCQAHRHPVPGMDDCDYCTPHAIEARLDRAADNADANREMGLPEEGEWGNK